MQTELHSYVDVVDHLRDWFGVDSTDAVTIRKAKRAVENAYRGLVGMRRWACYQTRADFPVVAMYNTGTVAYDHTGGTYERLVTLTDGTWPSWAKYGQIKIDSITYQVETRYSDTEITLSVNSNPGEDVAASTDYTLTRDTYPLPVDCQSIGTIRDLERGIQPEYVMFDDMVSSKLVNQAPTWPRIYTVLSDPNYVGTLAIRFYPPPAEVMHYEFMYQRVPKPLLTYQYNTGTVTTSGTTVTGSGTTFTSSMINSLIRFSSSTTAPTSTVGSNPFTAQRIITGYTSATSIQIDQALDSELSGVAYEISDVVDIESGAMYTAFLRKCELELGIMMTRDDVQKLEAQYRSAEIVAKEQDSRSFAPDPYTGTVRRRVPLRWTVANQT